MFIRGIQVWLAIKEYLRHSIRIILTLLWKEWKKPRMLITSSLFYLHTHIQLNFSITNSSELAMLVCYNWVFVKFMYINHWRLTPSIFVISNIVIFLIFIEFNFNNLISVNIVRYLIDLLSIAWILHEDDFVKNSRK